MNALLVLFSQPVQIGLFLAALAGSFMGRSAAAQGKFGKARTLAIVSFCASSLIAASNVVFAVLGSAMGFIMAALWVYIAYRDYQFLKMLPPRKR